MKKNVLLAVLVIVVGIVGLGVWALHQHSKTSVNQLQGIEGQVTGNTCKSGTTPVCYHLFVVVKTADGKHQIKRVSVDAKGNYEASLEAGTYTVTLESDPAGIPSAPRTLTLSKDQTYALNFTVSPPESGVDEAEDVHITPLPKH